MILNKFRLMLLFIAFFTFACDKSSNNTSNTTPTTANSDDSVIIEVNPTHFLTAGLTESITKVSQTLADGSSVMCYKIVSNNTPSDHTQGPWCPTNINDGIDKGGIWFEGGKLYDVDGPFVKNLATFYSNTTWKLYNITTGAINVTDTKAACEAAARPNVDPMYKNYCVQCLPSYFPGIKKIFSTPYLFKLVSRRN